MKFMLIMRATDESKAAYEKMPFEEVINAMGAYNESLMKAGVMLAGDGLADDPASSFVVQFTDDAPLVTDGPYGETHELFNGFWMIEVPTKEEAIEWAKKCPMGAGSKLEVRRVTDMSDFADFADNEFLRKEEGWQAELDDKAALDDK